MHILVPLFDPGGLHIKKNQMHPKNLIYVKHIYSYIYNVKMLNVYILKIVVGAFFCRFSPHIQVHVYTYSLCAKSAITKL